MIQLEGVRLQFQEQVIFDGLTEHIGRGDITGIYGKSGCGKSSFLKMLLGFIPVSSGKITVDGMLLNASNISEIRKRTAYLPQETNLPAGRVDELAGYLFSLQINKKIVFSEDKLFEYWNILHLDRKLFHRRLSSLSGGQRQRVMLSLIAMLERPLYLIDEPASALDAENAHGVLGLLQILKEQGCTVVVVSHNADFLNQCSRTIRF